MKKSQSYLILGIYLCSISPSFAEATSPTSISLGKQKINYYCLQALGAGDLEKKREMETSFVALSECQKIPVSPETGEACQQVEFSDSKRTFNHSECLRIERQTSDVFQCVMPLSACPKDEPGVGGELYFTPRVIGLIGNTYFLSIEFGGGGTGQFSTIMGVSFADKTGEPILKKQVDIFLGDRSSGGLQDSSIENGSLNYTVSLTPMDFLGLTGINSATYGYDNKTFGVVEGCANCSYALAHYRLTPPEQPSLISVSYRIIDPDKGERWDYWQKDYEANTPVQKCLKDILSQQEAHHHEQEFTAEQLKALGASLTKTCLSK
jgi:hypothetical protein